MQRSLRERLAALEQSVHRDPTVADSGAADAGDAEVGLAALGFTRKMGAMGGYFVRTLSYDLLTRHGARRFRDLAGCDLSVLSRTAKLTSTPQVAQLRFYDTETSGLGTGAGTFPFLHAIGRIVGDEFQLQQYFLADYADEPALLAAICDDHFHDADTVLVSFNGRTFDWPLFANRLVMYRQVERLGWPFAETRHIDLLHPSRRLWKSVFGSVSLGSLETNLLGLTRTADLPGKEAPARYFAYAQQPDGQLLAPVFDHNAMDVCSLVTLTVEVADVLAGRRPPGYAAEHLALGKWYDEWQVHELAAACYEAAADAPDADWRAHWLHSLSLKKRDRLVDACALWTRMVSRYPDSVSPVVELAKAAEHRAHDLAAAERWTLLAIECRLRQLGVRVADAAVTANGKLTVTQGATRIPPSLSSDTVLAALRHRLSRIRRKCSNS